MADLHPIPITITCPQCQGPVIGKVGKRFCSAQCRRIAWRATSPKEKIAARERYLQNIEQEKLKSKEYYAANRDKIKQRVKNWSAANTDKTSKTQKKWRDDNPIQLKKHQKKAYKKWRKANPEKAKAASKKWKDANPEKCERSRRKRIYLKNGALHEPYLKTNIFVRDNYICWICGCKTDPDKKHPDPKSPSIDHVIPLSKGGADTVDNVACACLFCNLSKKDKTITLF